MDVPRLLLLDACCVINFYATGRIEDILRGLPYRFAVARVVVEEEALGIARSEGEPHEREHVDLSALVDAGVLTVMTPTSADELAEYVRFARELDDGEAQTCDLAAVHHAAVATDDRKALRLLGHEGVDVLQTSELLHEWVERSSVDKADACDALVRVETLARFRPRASAPFADWWYRCSRSESEL